MTISIGELEALRAAMTGGRYVYYPIGTIETMCRSVNHTGSETEILTLGARNSPDDALGIVAEHNAMPVMLEVVKAALAYARPVETEQDARDKEVARRQLIAALAKVSP